VLINLKVSVSQWVDKLTFEATKLLNKSGISFCQHDFFESIKPPNTLKEEELSI